MTTSLPGRPNPRQGRSRARLQIASFISKDSVQRAPFVLSGTMRCVGEVLEPLVWRGKFGSSDHNAKHALTFLSHMPSAGKLHQEYACQTRRHGDWHYYKCCSSPAATRTCGRSQARRLQSRQSLDPGGAGAARNSAVAATMSGARAGPPAATRTAVQAPPQAPLAKAPADLPDNAAIPERLRGRLGAIVGRPASPANVDGSKARVSEKSGPAATVVGVKRRGGVAEGCGPLVKGAAARGPPARVIESLTPKPAAARSSKRTALPTRSRSGSPAVIPSSSATSAAESARRPSPAAADPAPALPRPKSIEEIRAVRGGWMRLRQLALYS